MQVNPFSPAAVKIDLLEKFKQQDKKIIQRRAIN